MFDSSQQFSTGTQYTGTVFFLVLALAAPLALLWLAQPITLLHLFVCLLLAAGFGLLAMAQWKFRSAISIPSLIASKLRSK